MPILSFSAGRERAAYLCKRIIWYGALIAACLLTHIPAAHAHDEDVPPSPEVTGLGVVAFVLILTWIIAMCRHAPQMARNAKRQNTACRKPSILRWLLRIFGWHWPARPPRDARCAALLSATTIHGTKKIIKKKIINETTNRGDARLGIVLTWEICLLWG